MNDPVSLSFNFNLNRNYLIATEEGSLLQCAMSGIKYPIHFVWWVQETYFGGQNGGDVATYTHK